MGDKIVIKLQMGKEGIPYYIKPNLIKPIISALKSISTISVLFDTPSLYPGSRDIS